jgi:hypothetical protein
MESLYNEIKTIANSHKKEFLPRKIRLTTSISKDTLLFLRQFCLLKQQTQSYKYSVARIIREIVDNYANEQLSDDFLDRWLGESEGERIFDLLIDRAGPLEPLDYIKDVIIKHLS